MSPRDRSNSRRKPVQDGYSDEERQDGYKLYGTVMLTGLFSLSVVLLIGLAIGASATVAIFVAVVFAFVLTWNVKRVLERRYREKHPGF